MDAAGPSMPIAAGGPVLATQELDQRTRRPVQHLLENEALLRLTDVLASAPETLLQRLADTLVDVCRSGSAGISLLQPGEGQPMYRWRAVSGALAAVDIVQGAQPKRLSPWTISLDRNSPQLFRRPARQFPDLATLQPGLEEVLIVPFAVDQRVIGTTWVVHHEPGSQFDREDARLLARLSRFAAIAWRLHETAAALREQQDQTAFALQATGIGVFRYDVATGQHEFSERLNTLWGLRPDERPTTDRLLPLVHPDDRELVRGLSGTLASDSSGRFSVEYRILQPDGRFRWIHSQGQTEFAGTGVARLAVRIAGTMRDVTERHLAQEELARREAQLDLATRIAGAGVFDHDYVQNMLYWSGRMREIHDLPPGAQPDIAALDAQLHPDDRAAHMAAVEAAGDPAGSGNFTSEYRIRRQNGEIRWILARAQTWFDRVGTQRSAVRTVGVEQDITQQKHIEAALRASQQHFIALADSVPVLVWTADAEGHCDYLNRRWYEYTGQNPESASGFGWIDAVHPDDRRSTERQWERCIHTGTALEAEYRLRRQDGTWRWFSVRATAQRDASGQIERWFGSSSDVDEIRRLVIASEQTTRRLRLATDAARLGIYEYFVGGHPHWDERAREISGFDSHEEVTRELFLSRLHPDDRRQAQESIEQALDPQRSRGRYDNEYRVINRSGRVCWVSSTGYVRFHDGVPLHVIGTVQDITVQKSTESLLRAADRRKDEFLATLAHELRNPLAPIRNAAQILAAPRLDAQALQWSTQVIQRQVSHMARLLDDLLDVARITEGKLELRRERIALSDVIETAVETARPLLDSKQHRLDIHLPDEEIEIDADPLRLAQIISNLLTNAAKYTDPGGLVTLSADVTLPNLVVRVRDTGIGLTAVAQSSIFEMFSQVTDTMNRSEGGLGIGLALVKGLVELHGGSISAHSEGSGCGSEFAVHLPLRIADAAKMPNHDAPQRTEARCGRRILVADDNCDAADSLGMILTLAGHDVQIAHGGRDALAIAARFRPDVVLLDIGMPDLNGYETARAMRKAPGGHELELIALTGWGHPDDKRRAAEAGFDRHLTKPVDPVELEALLRTPEFPAGQL